MIVVQCAMPMEAAPFLHDLPQVHRVEHFANQVFHIGPDTLVAITGIGLANAAAGTARALMLVDPELVIAAGTCGGLHPDIEVGTIAVATNAIYSMADATAFGYAPGQVPGMPESYDAAPVTEFTGLAAMQGRVVSADAFITAANVEQARAKFPEAIATDMETAAMAQTCHAAGVPWISLRAVSDLCGPAAGQDFHIDGALAAQRSYDAVQAFLDA